ncbi:methyltransferase [Marmoricola endophyticus]|uniref:Methyltransferase n=1 Tax=Marmoricola endophyticus TaxID=2040280 RepID=A0A917F242_9ACTN|nr:methyltransferase domain-containing protein [Marmoricola endophyticus]GGF42602.1 methyltransferase [Marmoricola endophyticus]
MAATIKGTDVEVPLAPTALRFMNENDDERFLANAAQLASAVQRLGLRPDDEVLDVGCSIGRLATGLMVNTDFRGRYVGFDVMPRQVRWARRHLAPIAEGYHFRHIDVRNDRYNPGGALEAEDVTFPARSDGFHVAVLFSIFTHFYKEDVDRYLRELRRVLRPGGRVIATWFLYDEDSYEAALTSAYPMVHRLDDVTIYNDPDDPLRAIAFDEGHVRAQVAAAGLEIELVEYGRWNGGPGPEWQDLMVLRRPEDPPPSFLDRVKGKVRRTFSRG